MTSIVLMIFDRSVLVARIHFSFLFLNLCLHAAGGSVALQIVD
jgi:hypothetical protein